MIYCKLILLVVVTGSVQRGVARPQLSLTILEEPSTTPRMHPPSPEDLEERRKALVAALTPAGEGVGNQIMTLQDLGLDLVGGIFRNSADVFAPLTNATRKAKEGLPRLGNVINRVADNARDYRKQVGGSLRDTLSTFVNNAIRIFTTASSRGAQIVGSLFRLLRTLLDNLTFSIQRLAQQVSSGIQGLTSTGTRFLATNIQRARKFLSSPRLLQPGIDATRLTVDTVKGLASDITDAQPWKSEIVKSSITLGNALIPRVRPGAILEEIVSSSADNPAAEEGYSQKRESSESSKEEGAPQAKTDVTLEAIDSASSNVVETKTTVVTSTSITTTSKPTPTTSSSTSSSGRKKDASGGKKAAESERDHNSLEDLFGIDS